jgi:hypothetical protein
LGFICLPSWIALWAAQPAEAIQVGSHFKYKLNTKKGDLGIFNWGGSELQDQTASKGHLRDKILEISIQMCVVRSRGHIRKCQAPNNLRLNMAVEYGCPEISRLIQSEGHGFMKPKLVSNL